MAKKPVPKGSKVTWKDPEDHGGSTYELPIGIDTDSRKVGRHVSSILGVYGSHPEPGSVKIHRPGD